MATRYLSIDEVLESVLNDDLEENFDDESEQDISDIENNKSNESSSCSEVEYTDNFGKYLCLLTSQLKMFWFTTIVVKYFRLFAER